MASSRVNPACLLVIALVACTPGDDAGQPDAGGLVDAASWPDATPLPDATPPPSFELRCGDLVDNDGDSEVDCVDADCAGHLACLAADCPVGYTRVVVEPTQLPQRIPPFVPPSDAPARMELYFPGPSPADGMANVQMQLSVQHPEVQTLGLFYLAPRFPVSMALAAGGGGQGADFDRTIFSDSGTLTVLEASPPYRGVFRAAYPEYDFVQLSEHAVDPDGLWTLIVENQSTSPGTLLAFAVSLCVCVDC
jgi:hypothetical protein